MSQGCVQILSDLLGESSMVMMALEGIERVLSVGDLRVVRNAIASHSHSHGDQGCAGCIDQVCAVRCNVRRSKLHDLFHVVSTYGVRVG